MEEIYLHTDIFNGNSSSGVGPWPTRLCTAATAAGCTQDNVVPSSQTNQAARPTSAVTAGLGLVHKHCSHSVTRCPSPLFLGRVSSSACPQATLPSTWVGCLGSLGVQSAVTMTAGLCSPDGSQKPIAPRILYFLLSPGSRRGLMTDALPALESSLPLGSINTLISHTKPSQVSPCSTSPSYQRTSVSSRPVLCHS